MFVCAATKIIGKVTASIFYFAHRVAGLAFELICGAFVLEFTVASPFTSLALYAPTDIFHFSLDTIFIHEFLPELNLLISGERYLSNRSPSAGNKLEDQRDHCQHQQEVNKSSHGVAAHNTQQPQHQQNDKQSPKHSPHPKL